MQISRDCRGRKGTKKLDSLEVSKLTACILKQRMNE
jgi:hypothetical protein